MEEQATTSAKDEMSAADTDTTEMVASTGSGEMPGTEATKEKTQSPADDLSKEIAAMRAALKKANGEATTYRLEANELKKYKEENETLKLSDQERQEASRKKLEQQYAELQAELATTKHTSQQYRINTEVKLIATQMGFHDPNDAVTYLDKSEIEKDEDGNPTNIKDRLTEMLKSKPYLRPQVKQSTSGGATNPPRSQTANIDNSEITWAYIEKVQSDPKAYEALPAERKRKIIEFMNDRKNSRGRR